MLPALPQERSICYGHLWEREREQRGRVCECMCVCQSICLSPYIYIGCSILSGAALISHNKFQFEARSHLAFICINFSLAAHFYLPIKIIPRQCSVPLLRTSCPPTLPLYIWFTFYRLWQIAAHLNTNCLHFSHQAAGRSGGGGGAGAKAIARQCVAFKLHIELWHFDSTPAQPAEGIEPQRLELG